MAVFNLPQDPSGFGPILEEVQNQILFAKKRKEQQAGLLLQLLTEYGGNVNEEQMAGMESGLGLRRGPIAESIMGGLGLEKPKPSMLRNIAQESFPTTTTETEGGATVSPGPQVYKWKGKAERETEAFGKKAALEEEAKDPYREKELQHKATLAANTLAYKEEHLTALTAHNKVLESISNARIKMLEDQGKSKEYIAEMKDATTRDVSALKDQISRLHIDIERGKLEAYKTKVESDVEKTKDLGKMKEKENIDKFINQMVNSGYMTVDPKNKEMKVFKELDNETKTKDVEEIAKGYGYKVRWTEITSAWTGKKTWRPTIDYDTVRGKTATQTTVGTPAATGEKPATNIPQVKTRADADAAIASANKAIEEGKDPVAVKKRLKEMGIEVK